MDEDLMKEALMAIEAIEAQEVQEPQGMEDLSPFQPSSPPVAYDPNEGLQGMRDDFWNDVTSLPDLAMEALAPVAQRLAPAARTLGESARKIGDFITGSSHPTPVRLGSLTQPTKATLDDGTTVQLYSDGRWYPVGTTFKKAAQKPKEPVLRPVEYLSGVKYILKNGKYVKDSGFTR